MSERERWVVYPLLFLALGASLRDKLVDRTTTKRIVCQELRIEDEAIGNQPARTLAMIGRTEATSKTPSFGFVVVNGEIAVDGAVKVNGAVSARQYGYLGIPTLQALPGITIPDLLRALQAAQGQQPPNLPSGKSPEVQKAESDPAESASGAESAPSKSNNADDAASKK